MPVLNNLHSKILSSPLKFTCAGVLISLMYCNAVQAATVVLENGDRMTGAIVDLSDNVLTFKSPVNYDYLSEKEKAEIGKLDTDFCEIHYEDQIDRFIRVTLTQKVIDACENLEYGLWVSLSGKNYSDYKDNFNNPNHETGYFGWLCSNIAEYGNTLLIPCDVMTKNGNDRPEIFPHKGFDHPFVRDYYNGILKKEAENRIAEMIKTSGNSRL
mgnify:CR=1 FL=1